MVIRSLGLLSLRGTTGTVVALGFGAGVGVEVPGGLPLPLCGENDPYILVIFAMTEFLVFPSANAIRLASRPSRIMRVQSAVSFSVHAMLKFQSSHRPECIRPSPT